MPTDPPAWIERAKKFCRAVILDPGSLGDILRGAVETDSSRAPLPRELVHYALDRFEGEKRDDLCRSLIAEALRLECWTMDDRAWLLAREFTLQQVPLHGEAIAPDDAITRLSKIQSLAGESRLATWCARKIAWASPLATPEELGRALNGPLPRDHFTEIAKLVVRHRHLRTPLASERASLSRTWCDIDDTDRDEMAAISVVMAFAAADATVARVHLDRADHLAKRHEPTRARLGAIIHEARGLLSDAVSLPAPTPARKPPLSEAASNILALSCELRARDAWKIARAIPEHPEGDIAGWFESVVEGAEVVLRVKGTRDALDFLRRADPYMDAASALHRFRFHFARATMLRWRLSFRDAKTSLNRAAEEAAWTRDDRTRGRLRAFADSMRGELEGRDTDAPDPASMVLAAFDEFSDHATEKTSHVRAVHERLKRAQNCGGFKALHEAELSALLQDAAMVFKEVKKQEPLVAASIAGYLCDLVLKARRERSGQSGLYSSELQGWYRWALEKPAMLGTWRLERRLRRDLPKALRGDHTFAAWADGKLAESRRRYMFLTFRAARQLVRVRDRVKLQEQLHEGFVNRLRAHDAHLSPHATLRTIQELKQTWIEEGVPDRGRRGASAEPWQGEVDLAEDSEQDDAAVAATLYAQRAAVLDYFVTAKDAWCAVVNSTDARRLMVTINQLPIDGNTLHKWRRELWKLGNSASEKPAQFVGGLELRMRDLFDHVGKALLAPVLHAINEHELLYIAPHGKLHGMPLHHARISGAPLWRNKRCLYVPKTRMVGPCRQSGAGYQIVADESDARTRHAAELLERILLPYTAAGFARRGGKCAPDSILGSISKFEITTFVAHGFFDTDAPMRSRLSLPGGTRITLRDLHRKDLHGGEVVLASCSTAHSVRKTLTRGELFSYVAAWLRAGVDAVMAPLWDVHYEGATIFVGQYLRARIRGAGRSEAWQVAMTAVDHNPLARMAARAFITLGADSSASASTGAV